MAKPLVVDQSNNNSTPDFKNLKAHGVAGYIHKLTEGTGFVDKYALSRIRAAKSVGMKTGLYHFARPDKNGARAEAQFYVANYLRVNGGKPGKNDFKPILDFEESGGGSSAARVAWIHTFNHAVHDKLGYYPIFYTYYYMARDLHAAKPLGSGLWLAGHPNQGIVAPSPWKRIYLYQTVAHGLGSYHDDIDISTPQTIFGLLPLYATPVRTVVKPWIPYWK